MAAIHCEVLRVKFKNAALVSMERRYALEDTSAKSSLTKASECVVASAEDPIGNLIKIRKKPSRTPSERGEEVIKVVEVISAVEEGASCKAVSVLAAVSAVESAALLDSSLLELEAALESVLAVLECLVFHLFQLDFSPRRWEADVVVEDAEEVEVAQEEDLTAVVNRKIFAVVVVANC